MAQVKIVWTCLAIADLDNAYDYIVEERPTAAAHTIERIEKAIQSISRYPGMGRPGRIEQTRELIVSGTPFIIPYRVKNNKIEILAVMHGARRWPDSF